VRPIREGDPPIRYVVNDTTAEKLGEILSRSDHGVLAKRDEFSGWIGDMDRYHSRSASDRGFWLKGYDGGHYNVDRINRGEIHIGNLSVSLLGGIQPDRLSELHGLTSDGLLQRFLPTMMRSATLPLDTDNEIERQKYESLIAALVRAPHRRMHFTNDALAAIGELRGYLFELEQAASGSATGFQGLSASSPASPDGSRLSCIWPLTRSIHSTKLEAGLRSTYAP
jgi:hypothetical protein